MKWWGLCLLAAWPVTSGCLDFEGAEAADCAKVGCASGAGTPDSPGVRVSGTPSSGATTHSTLLHLELAPTPDGATVSGYQCELDGASALPCSSPVDRSGLLEGRHTLNVRALNAQGKLGAATTWSWTVTPLSTTIQQIRNAPVEAGTRVALFGSDVQLTVAAADRFFIQEATTPYSGITVQPISFNGSASGLVHGRSMAVVGTVAQVNGNTTLVDATFTTGAVLDGYDARFGGEDGVPLDSEANEGMWVYDPGQAVSCAGHDFCLHDCDGLTLGAVDAIRQGLTLNAPRDFLGVLEGDGESGYRLYASEEQTGTDTCGP